MLLFVICMCRQPCPTCYLYDLHTYHLMLLFACVDSRVPRGTSLPVGPSQLPPYVVICMCRQPRPTWDVATCTTFTLPPYVVICMCRQPRPTWDVATCDLHNYHLMLIFACVDSRVPRGTSLRGTVPVGPSQLPPYVVICMCRQPSHV